MSQEQLKTDICKQALAILRDRRAVILPQLFSSIENQLNWLVSYFEGASTDRSKLFQLNFGHIAVREIDAGETELISALNKAFYVASKTGHGLKIDPKELGIDS